MKIANKISLSFLFTTIIITIIASSIFYVVIKHDLLNMIDDRLDAIVYSRAQHVETYLRMLKESVKQLSKNIVLENFLKTKKEDAIFYKEAFEIAQKMLINTKAINPSISDFQLLDKTGIVIASSNKEDIGRDISTDAFFTGGQKNVYIKDVYYSETAAKGIMGVSAPIFDSNTGRFLGVIVTRVDLTDLYKILVENMSFGKTEEIFIINKYGYMITPSRFLKDTFLKQKVDTENSRSCLLYRDFGGVCSLNKKIIVCPDYRGIMIAGSNAYIKEMQWSVLSKIDRDEVLLPLRHIQFMFLLILIGAPLAAWFLGTFISMIITGPIHKLHRGTEVVGEGNLDYKFATESNDEIGQLSRAFNKMTSDLKYTTTSINNLNKEIIRRSNAEESLRALASIVESSEDAILSKDLNGIIKTWNKGAELLYGYSEKEVVGKNIFIIASKEYTDELSKVLQKIKAGQKIKHYETMRQRKDGTLIPVSLSMSPLMDIKGNIIGISSIAHDITERKKLEEVLRKYSTELAKEVEEKTKVLRESQDSLVRTEKLAIVGKLAASVAHELRNPLGVMKNAAYYLNMLEFTKNNPELKENLDIISQEIENSDKIIMDLLEFSRTKKPVFWLENINIIVKEILNRLTISPDIELSLELRDDLPQVEVDALQMHQIFYNMAINALESMEKGGKFKIKTDAKGDFVEVSFSDTGSGINKENLQKIFEPLFSTKTKGTGLGLSVCAMLVQEHDGKIEVESEVGKGSTFTVKLPIKRG